MAALLSGCALPTPPQRPALYDFGPDAAGVPPPRSTAAPAPSPTPAAADAALPLLLRPVEASPALDGTAMLYRLGYADAAQLRPYALARWSMPPAQLLRQRLQQQLAAERVVLSQPDALAPNQPALELRVELDEFSQVYDAPDSSRAVLRLRATLLRRGAAPEAAVGGATAVAARPFWQRSVQVERPSPGADAAGGAQALRAAVDAAVRELSVWLRKPD